MRWWSTDTSSIVGTLILAALAVGFVLAARRRSRSGRTWPIYRTTSYVGGCAVVAVTLFSGIAHNDDVFGVHVGQHLVLMMVAPILLVLGGPLRLALRTLPRRVRHEASAILADPLVRRVSSGRRTALWLCADYYGSMAVYLLTPLYRWSTQHELLHITAHMYFLSCGLLFWVALIGEDPMGQHITWPVQRAMLALGVPFYLVLGAAVALLPNVRIFPGASTAGTVLAVGGSALSLAGLAVLSIRVHPWRRANTRGNPPNEAREGARPWRAAF